MGDKSYEEDMKVKLDKDEWSEWYNTLVEAAGLSDKRYPIKGMNIWMPYGWKIMRAIDELTHREMERTGHDEVCFPLLIPEAEFQREADHIKGFGSEVYWVTRGGDNDLDIPLLLRPTSETAMYSMFSLWIRAHTDLPLKIYQVVNVFRYETKMTRTFVRVREIHFFEAHTAHASGEEAEAQIAQDLEIMENISRHLCLPHLKLKRPDWDKFAGAEYSVGVDTIMPTGRTLQIGGIHQYMRNFAKAYDIIYEDAEANKKHAYQTTYGMSERLVGTIISVHGDNRGLIMPPDIAPVQVVIVPIFRKDTMEEVLNHAGELGDELRGSGLRVHVDPRDVRPGQKFYHWELKGIPIRVEIGPRDIKKGGAVVVRRDSGGKDFVAREELAERINQELETVNKSMLERAVDEALEKMTLCTADLPHASDTEGIYCVPLCGREACSHSVEDRLDMNMLGLPYQGFDAGRDIDMHEIFVEQNDIDINQCTCIDCGAPAEIIAYFARTH